MRTLAVEWGWDRAADRVRQSGKEEERGDRPGASRLCGCSSRRPCPVSTRRPRFLPTPRRHSVAEGSRSAPGPPLHIRGQRSAGRDAPESGTILARQAHRGRMPPRRGCPRRDQTRPQSWSWRWRRSRRAWRVAGLVSAGGGSLAIAWRWTRVVVAASWGGVWVNCGGGRWRGGSTGGPTEEAKTRE